MGGTNFNAEPRNEREASQVLGGGSTDLELAKAFGLSGVERGDSSVAGHRQSELMAGGAADVVAPGGKEQFLDRSVVIPSKYIPDGDIQPDGVVELMHFDFGTPITAQLEDAHGPAANEDIAEQAA